MAITELYCTPFGSQTTLPLSYDSETLVGLLLIQPIFSPSFNEEIFWTDLYYYFVCENLVALVIHFRLKPLFSAFVVT